MTATGLVDPENAKQLGKFAGVDALIIGNIIPIGSNTTLTVKIITTETAEVVGAAKAKFKTDDTVQQFLSQPAQANDSSAGNQPTSPMDKPFGDLQASVDSLDMTPGDGVYGYATMTLIITNTSPSLTYTVGVNPDFYRTFNLSNKRGDVFHATEVTGIDTCFESFRGLSGNLTDLAPKSAITVVAKSQVRWTGKAGEYRPYRFQTEAIFGVLVNGTLPVYKKYNIVLDIK